MSGGGVERTARAAADGVGTGPGVAAGGDGDGGRTRSPSWGCVVLTAGRAPEELRRAVDSLLAQSGIDIDLVVLGNGCEPAGLPAGARVVALAENQGIPGGRNAGAASARGELLFFLDDDAEIVSPETLARLGARFAAEPDLGLVQLRVEPRTPGPEPSNWVPRLGAAGRMRSGEVTVVWEGAVAIPRRVLDDVGGWPAEFRFIHEGVDLAWRVMDRGLRVHYAAELAVRHPPHEPLRHDYSLHHAVRNRVWVARRNLPLPLGVLYVASFALRLLPALRSRAAARTALGGLRAGVREPCGPRRALRARTLWRMLRAGRPPVV